MPNVRAHSQQRSQSLTHRVLNAISVFGGTEALRILSGIVRAKFVAIWVGTAGVGLFGIFNAAIELIGLVTQLNVRSSSVREISAASSNPSRLGRMISVVRRLALILGLVGMGLTLAFSGVLSEMMFGSKDYSWAFIALSIVLLLNSVSSVEQAILQGVGRLSSIAKITTISVIVSLALSLPIIYIWRLDGIVPVIICFALCMAIVTMFYHVKNTAPARRIAAKELRHESKGLLSLGFYLTIASLFTWGANVAFMSFLNHTAGIDIVGQFQAGYTLVFNYAGVIFMAIGVEYYPRMSAISNGNNRRLGTMMWHEIKIVSFVVLPFTLLFSSMSHWIVQLLYSADFIGAVPFITIGSVAFIFRGASWCMAFIMMAKSDGKVYLLTEGASGIICLALSIIGYHTMGLIGIGYAYVAWYALYFLIVWAVIHYRYKIRNQWGILALTIGGTIIAAALALTATYFSRPLAIIAAAILLIAAALIFLLRQSRSRR